MQSVEIYHDKMQDQNCTFSVNLCSKDQPDALHSPSEQQDMQESTGQQKGQHGEKHRLIQLSNRNPELRLPINTRSLHVLIRFAPGAFSQINLSHKMRQSKRNGTFPSVCSHPLEILDINSSERKRDRSHRRLLLAELLLSAQQPTFTSNLPPMIFFYISSRFSHDFTLSLVGQKHIKEFFHMTPPYAHADGFHHTLFDDFTVSLLSAATSHLPIHK